MKLFSIVFSLVLFLSFIPAHADCGKPDDNKDIDTQCKDSVCKGAGFKDGCYQPPDGNDCSKDYTKTPPDDESAICCCK